MARQARKLSDTGIYHVVFRGVNRCHLFEEHDDFEKLLDLIARVKAELLLEVYAYCLLDNHVHLLIKEQAPGDIVRAMRKLLTPYAYWFNRKYLRSGALIANRYRSECVESDEYLLTLIRYIHQNPLAAGITNRIDDYRYSSFCDYAKRRGELVDTSFVLGMFADDETKAKRLFSQFHNVEDQTDCSLPDKVGKSENQVRAEIADALGGLRPSDLAGLPRQERDAVLALLRKQGLSIRQIERTTGISRGIVARCYKA